MKEMDGAPRKCPTGRGDTTGGGELKMSWRATEPFFNYKGGLWEIIKGNGKSKRERSRVNSDALLDGTKILFHITK